MERWTKNILIGFSTIILISGCGNTVNDSNITEEETIPHPDWISQDSEIQKASLSKIVIPGAHDAGMGKITGCSTYAAPIVTQTQDKTFAEMLNYGIRYFDIRAIIDKENNLRIGHFQWIGEEIYLKTFIDDALDVLSHIIGKFLTDEIKKELEKTSFYNDAIGLRNEGCYGYSIDDLLNDVNTFMENSHNEIVILDFSHFMNFKKYDIEDSHFDDEDVKRLADTIDQKIGNYLIKENIDLLDTPIETLTENGSKVIVIFSDSSYGANYEGIYHTSTMNIYNQYSNTSDLNKMESDQFQKSIEYSEDRYFLLSWTLTMNKDEIIGCMLEQYVDDIKLPSYFGYSKKLKYLIKEEINKTPFQCKSIRDLATIANDHISDIPNDPSKGEPNIIFFDFILGEMTQKAIDINKNRVH